MDKSNFSHSKIIKIKPYQDADNHWLFNLTYELWDDDGNKAELNIPCVQSPFYNGADAIELWNNWVTDYEIRDGNNNLVHTGKRVEKRVNIKTLDNVEICAVNDSGKSLDCNGKSLDCSYLFNIKYIKRRMTIDDIEKELGYKVVIIDRENTGKDRL